VEPETREKTESGSWRAYWEELSDDQQIFKEQSDEYARNVLASVISGRVARVLDFGCGFGHVAKMLAPHVGELHLWDASANMRRRARLNVAGCQNIRFLDLSNPESDDSQLQFELILVNSVVQYMTSDEFSAWLLRWRKMLGTGGRIVVSDLIPPSYPALRDILDLLRFSARRGFLVRAVWQAFSEIWSYWGVRRTRPLSRTGREELTRVGEDSGLAVSFLPVNLTHFKKRLTAAFTLE
jgi:SAM-dependent methyltransferase